MMRRLAPPPACPPPRLRRRSVLAAVAGASAAALAAPLWAQVGARAGAGPGASGAGFAGLGAPLEGALEGYAPVLRETRLRFPEDHGPHPGHRIEWWYVTATLTGEDGRDYGVQWTLFRNAIAPPTPGAARAGWAAPQVWMAHIAATSAETHVAAERFARGAVGWAGAEASPFRAHLGPWRFESLSQAPGAPFSPLRLAAASDEPAFAYDLTLSADGPMVLQGVEGYSVKSERGHASHYYSQPYFDVEGSLLLSGRTLRVTGSAWMDREWSSRFLDADQSGWDWFSLQLGAERVMLFQLRSDTGAPYFAGNWITPDGRSEPLEGSGIRLAERRRARVAGRDVPVAWRIEIPERGVAIDTVPLNPQAWMPLSVPYWEGPIRISGSHEGRGYLEMSGY